MRVIRELVKSRRPVSVKRLKCECGHVAHAHSETGGCYQRTQDKSKLLHCPCCKSVRQIMADRGFKGMSDGRFEKRAEYEFSDDEFAAMRRGGFAEIIKLPVATVFRVGAEFFFRLDRRRRPHKLFEFYSEQPTLFE